MGAHIAAAGIGLVGSLLSRQKEGGKDAGNAMLRPQDVGTVQNAQMQGLQGIQGATNANATQDVMNNPMLSGMFGAGGTMQRTGEEEQRLANQGFALTPEDRTAYGQASGDIARQYGQQDQSLAQAMASRGMSNSGAAGAAFSGAQGNKMEQLAKAQQNIAQQRYHSNLERLGQTRQFLTGLGVQAQQGIGQAYQERLGTGQAQLQGANKLLGGHQDQQNEGLSQQQATEHESGLSSAFSGLSRGAMAGAGGAMSLAPTNTGTVMPGTNTSKGAISGLDYSKNIFK